MSEINTQDQNPDDMVRPELTDPVATEPVETQPITDDPAIAAPDDITPPPAAPARRPIPRTRVGTAWVGLCVLAVLAIAFIVFMLQNTGRVQVTFLNLHASLPLAVALLIAAVAGALLVLCIGTIRITQLRRMARRAPTQPS